MYVHCAQLYCNTQPVTVRTHRYRPSQYNLLCTFSVHHITVTHNLLLSEHTVTDRHSTVFTVHNITLIPWKFQLTESFRLHNGPVVDSASNRNEYKGYFLGVKLVWLRADEYSCDEYLEIW